MQIAAGFPVPLSARFRLPPYAPTSASLFLRKVVRDICHHEIDEQLLVGDTHPFTPQH